MASILNAHSYARFMRGGFRRNTLAQLCRGFLLLQGKDGERAKAFLVVFLVELVKAQAQLPNGQDS